MSFEKAFADACAEQEIAGAVFAATDVSGKFNYTHSIGVSSLRTNAPFTPSTIMMIASLTKLLTAISTLQCVAAGHFTLDEDIGRILPEYSLSKAPIISEGPDGNIIYSRPTRPVTLRRLLTHSSGIAYELLSPLSQKWSASINRPVAHGTTVQQRYGVPLLFEPGTGWAYGPGQDWAGVAIERVTGLKLEEYMRKHIFAPLGAEEGFSFWPEKRGWGERMAECAVREGGIERAYDESDGGGKVVWEDSRTDHVKGMTEASGGAGGWASAEGYIRVLGSLLRDDDVLLGEKEREELFRGCLREEAKRAVQKFIEEYPMLDKVIGRFIPTNKQKDFAVGGVTNVEAQEGWRGKGTLMWSGLLNCYMWIDREKGLCGIIGMQQLPSADVKTMRLVEMAERGIYTKFEEWKIQSTA